MNQLGVGEFTTSGSITAAPWFPFAIAGTALLVGFGLAYMVTRPKSPEQVAYELAHEAAVRNHIRKLRGRK